MKSKKFIIPLYGVELFVVVGKVTGQDLYDLVLKRTGKKMPRLIKEGVEQADGCCNRKDNVIVVWLKTIRGAEGMNTLSHEALHCAFEVMRHAGVMPSASSEEAYAYLIGWTVQTILQWRAT